MMPNYQSEALGVDHNNKVDFIGYIFLSIDTMAVALGLMANSFWMFLIVKQVKRMMSRRYNWTTASQYSESD
mgnify:CR=1 FL=1